MPLNVIGPELQRRLEVHAQGSLHWRQYKLPRDRSSGVLGVCVTQESEAGRSRLREFLTSKSHLGLYLRLVRSGVHRRIGKCPLLGAAQACLDSMRIA